MMMIKKVKFSIFAITLFSMSIGIMYVQLLDLPQNSGKSLEKLDQFKATAIDLETWLHSAIIEKVEVQLFFVIT